ncbi:hypothetical protein [Caballeronia insecticola]|uniref:Uncharacterized protein n=1 Tax=Caballeronia insecticola TaxID=758793 RepID=R4WNG2_9BURK|nr:hypothetical protein [Caballeronia insecticola]BAN26173.1 hypothetical protein BRPE64_CCDS00900 [Caballeronia insecticola]
MDLEYAPGERERMLQGILLRECQPFLAKRHVDPHVYLAMLLVDIGDKILSLID